MHLTVVEGVLSAVDSGVASPAGVAVEAANVEAGGDGGIGRRCAGIVLVHFGTAI